MFFNEEAQEVTTGVRLQASGVGQVKAVSRLWIDPLSLKTISYKEGDTVIFKPYEMKILMVRND
jgi:co-chaperonin GroES (HSP10)